MGSDGGRTVVLAACRIDRRLWVFDPYREVAVLIPLTVFYSELMRVQRIRDPHIVLNPDRFFSSLPSSTDRELTEAFQQYNKVRPKLSAADSFWMPSLPRKSRFQFVRNFLVRPKP
jgi:hypothetical protein